MRGWRPLTWVILIINVLFLVLVISAVSAGTSADDEALAQCKEQASEFFTEEDCKNATEAGSAIGAGIAVTGLLVFWVLIDIILGIIWLVTNRSKRQCPQCGNDVKKGLLECKKCGYDFRVQQQTNAPPPAVT